MARDDARGYPESRLKEKYPRAEYLALNANKRKDEWRDIAELIEYHMGDVSSKRPLVQHTERTGARF